jgi:AP-1 complex subunit beta-1
VRRSIKVTEKAAVNIDAEAERCVNVLLDLIATRVSYVVQEAVVVMKVFSFINTSELLLIWSSGYFRRYPSTYEGVFLTLYANLEELDKPEAKRP